MSKIARALSVGFFRHPSRVFAQARRSGCPWFWIICGECFCFLQKDEELGGGHGSSTTYTPNSLSSSSSAAARVLIRSTLHSRGASCKLEFSNSSCLASRSDVTESTLLLLLTCEIISSLSVRNTIGRLLFCRQFVQYFSRSIRCSCWVACFVG